LYVLDETGTGADQSTHKSARSTSERRKSTTNRTRQASAISSTIRNKSANMLTATTRRKREQQNESLQVAIMELLNHFSHRNLDAIVRVIRMTLEKLRKRITSTLSYGNFRSFSFHFFFFLLQQVEIIVKHLYSKSLLN